jgi:hypothetical protein
MLIQQLARAVCGSPCKKVFLCTSSRWSDGRCDAIVVRLGEKTWLTSRRSGPGSVRRLLYRRLVALFGPLAKWEKTNSPGKGLDDMFDQFCTDFARAVGAKSAGAVQHQIRFAMPETTRGSTWERHAQTAILNKAAALEAGFIEDKHLPNVLAVGRTPTMEEILDF